VFVQFRKKPEVILKVAEIPQAASDEILKIMNHCQADAGSVEFFLQGDTRVYFDINMLSTLPDPSKVQDDTHIWAQGFDPWAQLASFVTAKCKECCKGC